MVLALSLTNDLYLRRLGVLGAWWCLGSSSVEPELLIEYEAVAERKAARTSTLLSRRDPRVPHETCEASGWTDSFRQSRS